MRISLLSSLRARKSVHRNAKGSSPRRAALRRTRWEQLENRVLLAADLAISKTQIAPVTGSPATPAPVVQGEMLSYAVTIQNNGSSDASNVSFADMLPAGETLISATSSTGGALNANGSSITGNLGTIAAGGSATVTIDVLANGQISGSLSNTASISTPDENGGTPIISAPVSTLINTLPSTAADLSITKTAANNNGAVSAGGSETYTITVTNHGTNSANDVVVSDLLPTGATFVSGTATVGTGSPTNLTAPTNGLDTINLGTLAAGESATISMTVTAPSLPGVMVNSATVSTSSGNTNLANAAASIATAVQGTTTPTSGNVDLSISKTAATTASSINLGADETYTITVVNNGSANATGVVVNDVLPFGATFVSGSADLSGVNVASANGLITANVGNLAAGATATITVTIRPSAVGAVTDTAYVEASQPDQNQANNSASATTLVSGVGTPVDLSVTKTPSAATGTVGQNETYTITVTNNSANAATGVVLSDVLPTNATFVSASAGGASLMPINNVLTDTIGSLAAGASSTLTVTLAPTAVGAITDTALVASSQADPNLANNIATLTTPVQGSVTPSTGNVDLSVSKTAANNNSAVGLGSNESYTITVTNKGSADATGVVLSDALPAGATFVSGTSNVSGVSVMNVNGAAMANIGNLAAGASATITVVVKPGALGPMTDTASVEANQIDLNQADNLASLTTQVVSAASQANLSIMKLATPNPDTVGQALTYVLVVANTGLADANDVVVTDNLPSGTTFVSGSTNVSGVNVTNSNGSVTANLGTVAAGTIDTILIVVTPTQAGMLTNTADVTTSTLNASSQTSATTQTTINPAGGNQANLSITKTASPTTGTVGQNLTYTITVSNASGAAAADNVAVTDSLPSGVTFVSATDSLGNTLTPSAGTLTDSLGSLAAGATDTITLIVTPTQAGTLTNTANVSTSTANSNSNTSATVQTTVNPSTGNQANLSITKTASPSPGAVGQNLTYTITVTNATGAANAANVKVSDTLPDHVTFVSAVDTTSGATLTNNDGTIVDNIGTMAAGATETITIVVMPQKTGTLANTASVTTTTSNASNQTSATINTLINKAGSVLSCFLNGQPGDGSDQTFLTNLYREVLGRNPDTSGFQHWLAFLQNNGGQGGNGGQSSPAVRQQLIQAFLNSQEYKTHFVDCVFDLFLGRHADKGGERFFVKMLDSGAREQDVLVALLSSQEYFAHNGHTNQAFVDNLYQNLLGRQADPTSEQAWVSALNSKQFTRQQVVEAFLDSPEAAHNLLSAAGASTGGAPGTAATGDYPLAALTGDGWNNLYYQGNLSASQVDQFMNELESATAWQTVQQQMLDLPQYFG